MTEKILAGLVLLDFIFWMWFTISMMEDNLKFRIIRRKRNGI